MGGAGLPVLFGSTVCPLRGFPALLAERGVRPNSRFLRNRSNKGSLLPRSAAMLGCTDSPKSTGNPALNLRGGRKMVAVATFLGTLRLAQSESRAGSAFFRCLVQPSIADVLRLSERCLSRSRDSANGEFSERAKRREAQGTRAAGKPSSEKSGTRS